MSATFPRTHLAIQGYQSIQSQCAAGMAEGSLSAMNLEKYSDHLHKNRRTRTRRCPMTAGQLEFLHWFLFDRDLGTVLKGNAVSAPAARARYKNRIEKWSVI